MSKILSQILAGILGLTLSIYFVPGVKVAVYPDSSFFGFQLTAVWQVIMLLGIALGILNTFVKPIINLITLPLRILTLGIFSLIINMAIIWTIDLIFPEITIQLFLPLFWTSIIVWGLSIIFLRIFTKKEIPKEA
ncbi:phage holin family protein [Patescibacteria group bacterium]|nr:phage holin family protein [Patescibacteria group bacterium]